MAKGKKGGKQQQQNKPNANTQEPKQQQENTSKNEEMTKIMTALQNMDLDDENFIDVKSFDQSKAILENAIQDLQHYLKFFEKGEYDKFPKAKVDTAVTQAN